MSKAPGLSPVVRFSSFLPRLRFTRIAHEYEREVFLIASIGLSAFFVTALASFQPLDVSLFAISTGEVPPENLAGALGANVAAGAVFAFGIAAALVPVPLLMTALLFVRRSDAAFAFARLLGWTLSFLSLTAICALRVPAFTWAGFDFPGGGVLGEFIAKGLLRSLGQVGSLIAIATVALCALILVMRKSLLMSLLPIFHSSESVTKTKRLPLWWDQILHRNSPQKHSGDIDVGLTPERSPLVGVPEDVDASIIPDKAEFDDSADEERDDGPNDANGILQFAPLKDEPGSEGSLSQIDDAIKTPGVASVSRLPSWTAYSPPPISVFNKADPTSVSGGMSQKDLEATAALLVTTFEDFGVLGKVIGYQPGPVVTVFEFQPDAGVKQSKIVGLIDDLALALKVDSIFIHPVRGKRALGVQVPNSKREPVHLGDILATPAFKDSPSPLTFGMGKTISGQPMCADLTAMPHLLVAGATGSGKSVCINGMLCSIIMKAAPEDVRAILVDPKMLELSVYEGIPHLLMPVITEPAKASLALKWAVVEMERRYKLMQLACVRNIAGFNDFLAKATPARRAELAAVVGDLNLTRLPYILLVIDELADLMMTAPKDVESSIQRLAQKARASGIHMVLATQRPSVDIITGVIKANLPCRIAFQVVSKHDSRTILDLIGAEKLLGKGDMLLQRPGVGRLERLQGALITDEEVLNLVANVKSTSPVHYDDSIISWIDDEYARQKDGSDEGGESMAKMDDDPKWDEAVALARANGVVSASFLQRHLKIGYNRAARIVEFMEGKGFVDKADGAKPRKWLGPVG